jgi:flagellin
MQEGAMRINHNISALNTHRSLVQNTEAQKKSLERLSSGLKINRAADGPAKLIISERLRAQREGLKQAIDNSEAGISLMQTAEAALEEVNRSLVQMRQLAVHAANEAVNDEFMLEADQQEVDNALEAINRIAHITTYGKKSVLNGSMGLNGVTVGDHLEFIEGSERTQTSPVGGYEVRITQAAKRNEHVGSVALTQAIIDAGEQIRIAEGGKTLAFETTAGDSVEETMNKLDKAIRDSGMAMELVRDRPMGDDALAPQFIRLRHKQYGSEFTFQVATSTAGLLSSQADVYDTIENGLDVQGTIGGEVAFGRGQTLTGSNPTKISGLKIRYTGEDAPPDGFAGTITVSQRSQDFQIGPNNNQTAKFSLKSVHSRHLGRGIVNTSGFDSLEEIDLRSHQKAQDSLRLIDKSIEQITSFRGRMGAFQKNTLQSNLNYLRQAHEEVTNSESVIRDADMAEEMTAFTRNQIMVESSTAMLAQANQTPFSVMKLLNVA